MSDVVDVVTGIVAATRGDDLAAVVALRGYILDRRAECKAAIEPAQEQFDAAVTRLRRAGIPMHVIAEKTGLTDSYLTRRVREPGEPKHRPRTVAPRRSTDNP